MSAKLVFGGIIVFILAEKDSGNAHEKAYWSKPYLRT